MDQERNNRRTQVLRYVEQFLRENGYAPTCEEIRAAMHLSSKSHAAYYLGILERQGVIEKKPRSPRGLKLVTHIPGRPD